MQDTNNESVTFGSEGSLSQSGAELTERIYSEVPPRPSSDDETLKPGDVEGLTVENGDVEAEENDRDDEQSQEQALLEESNKEPPLKPPHTRPEDLEEFNAQQPVYHEIGDKERMAEDIPLSTMVDAAGGMPDEEKSDDKKAKPKQKDKKKLLKRDRLASYESISLGDRSSVGRSTESVKEAVKAAKRAKENCSGASCPRARIVFGILVGLGVGVFSFLFLYLLLGRHVLSAVVISLIIGVITADVLAFFDMTRMKCVILLVFPSIFSSGAKISLWILLTYLIISGPTCNLIENVRMAATRSCMMDGPTRLPPTAPTAEQQTAAQTDPRTQYLIDNIKQFQNLTDELGHYLNETLTTNETSLLSGVICEEQLAKAQQRCSRGYESLIKNCTDVLFGWRLQRRCQEFIKRDALCVHVSTSFILSTCGRVRSAQQRPLTNMALMLQKQPEPTVEPSFTEENRSKEDNNTWSSVSASRAQVAELSRQQCRHVVVLEMLLALLIFAILYEAYRYHKHYLVYNEFDNCYLTLHFASIENNRRANGAADGLMPLKKSELQLYVQPTSCGLSRAEKKSVLKYLIIFLVHLAFALVFILGDFFFYQAITSGEPGLDTRDNKTLSGVCEAQLKSPDEEYRLINSVLLGILLLLILLQPYALRLRRYIAGRFYKTRERTRVTYLYYKLLEERKAFYKSTIERINRSSEENTVLKRLDAMLVLAQHFPAFGKVMGFLGVSLKRCMVCGTGLNWKYVMCDTEECNAVYCRMCFWDVESNCLGCMNRRTRLLSTRSRADGNENNYV